MLQIKKIREENNITQQQLSEASGLNLRWIQKLESGEINIENVTVKNFALLLKGLNALVRDDIISDDFLAVKNAYVVIRELLS